MTLYALIIGNPPGAPDRQGALRRSSLLKTYPRLALGALVAAGLLAALSFPLKQMTGQQAQAAVSGAVPAQPHWIDIAKPYALYTLEAPELARLPRGYEARRQNNGAGRQDILSFGGFGINAAWLRINIRRFGQENAADTGFFVDVARRAAEAGLAVGRSGLPQRFGSRFGPLDMAGISLERGQLNLACQAFRMTEPGPGLTITGLYCPSPGKSAEPGNIVCLLDRLALTGGGEDAALRQIFVAAELRREQFCQGGKYQAPAAVSASPPPLRPAARAAGRGPAHW